MSNSVIHLVVLVIGFSLMARKIIEVTFGREGVSITKYEDPAEMLRAGEHLSIPPDVVFINLDLSEKRGYHLVRQLRLKPQFKQVTIIGVSHHKSIFFRLKAWCVGTHIYLIRPISSQKLIQVVMEHSRH